MSTQIVDTTGDGWMFHISADPSLRSALWAARRIADGHVAVVANDYTLREVDPDDPDTMYGANLFGVTKDAGLWDGNGAFDWSMVLGSFEDRPWYRSLRQWRYILRSISLLGTLCNITSFYAGLGTSESADYFWASKNRLIGRILVPKRPTALGHMYSGWDRVWCQTLTP
eukprot:1178805-Prorocentrum_minimum.AAC.1